MLLKVYYLIHFSLVYILKWSHMRKQIHKTCLLLKNSKYIEVHKIKSPCYFLQSNPLLQRFLKAHKITDICNFTDTDRTPLQYSCLENPMDRGAWWAAVHGVTRSQIRLSDFTFTFHFHALEKELATHSSVLAWRIPGTGEPGELLSMGSHRVGHDWSDLAAAAADRKGVLKSTLYLMHLFLKLHLIDYLSDAGPQII